MIVLCEKLYVQKIGNNDECSKFKLKRNYPVNLAKPSSDPTS